MSVEASPLVTLSSDFLAHIAERYLAASKTSLIGRLLVCNPGPKILSDWCKSNFHNSFSSAVSLGQRFFEVLFHQPAGRLAMLLRSDFTMQGQRVLFSPWEPSFDPDISDSIAMCCPSPYGHSSRLSTRTCTTQSA
jgi:hypothetical protein